jgi:hypothetical protein
MWPHPLKWRDLDSFVQGYIEALFFTENEPQTTRAERNTTRRTVRKTWEAAVSEGTQHDIPGDYGFADLAPEALLYIIKDCNAFQERAAELLQSAYARDYNSEQAGRDFWYTRNGHGVGFWCREELRPEGEEYEALTAEMVVNPGNNAVLDAACAKREALKENSLGERLSKIATSFREADAYVGDDLKVYHQ